jgi:hypothetical protein
MAESYGLPHRGQHWRALAAQVKSAINRHLWDEERGVYVDARVDGMQSRRVSQHANGICLAYDIAPHERHATIIPYITDPQRIKLTSTGMSHMNDAAPFDEERDVVLAQPFFSHHLHRGLIQAGEIEWVLQNIRERWGAMLEAGSSTIWELWSPLASQCHAWSTTPTFDLSTYVLGVVPLVDGFREVLIAPHPGDLAWAQGRFPTPHGAIEVSWQSRDEEFHLEITLPEAISVQVAIPLSSTQVEVNGQALLTTGQHVAGNDGVSLIESNLGKPQLAAQQGGRYSIVARSK